MEIVIIDKRAKTHFKYQLARLGYKVVETIDLDNFRTSLSTHPDIQLTKLGPSEVIVEPRTYDYYKKRLKKYNIRVTKGSTIVEDKYPRNIGYNLAYDGRVSIHNFSHTDSVVLEEIDKSCKINVNQGYSKCSIAFVSDLIITQDPGIYKKVLATHSQAYGKILLIRPGHIHLEGYNYGFIGGTSGYNDTRSTIYFLGDIKSHPDGNLIIKYLDESKTDYVSLSPGKLQDHGSLIFLQGDKEKLI